MVGALTGRPELGGLAGELFGAITESESRVSERLVEVEKRLGGVERRLTALEAGPFQMALNAGMRSLMDAAADTDPAHRADEFRAARQRFLEASAAASVADSLLQTAVAERFLLLCAVALEQPERARVAWDRINEKVTVAALELDTAFRSAVTTAERHLREDGDVRPGRFGNREKKYNERLREKAAQVRGDVADSASVVRVLLVEAGALGLLLGQPSAPEIEMQFAPEKTTMPRRLWAPMSQPNPPGNLPVVNWSTQPGKGPVPVGQPNPRFLPSTPVTTSASLRWQVKPTGRVPTRFGALTATWDPAVVPLEELNAPRAKPFREIRIGVTIEADPPLSRTVQVRPTGRTLTSGPPRGGELTRGRPRFHFTDVAAVRAERPFTGLSPVYLDNIAMSPHPGVLGSAD
jgi:hypothetical protein